MERAYAALHVKQLEDRGDFVFVKGIASTPTTDRAGDVVNPMGAQFKTPMPLLWQHKADKPVGRVTFAKPSKSGIPFEAEIPRIKVPGLLKDRIDEAIQSLEHRLVAFTSIGFSADPEHTKRLPTGGLQFDRWSWHELSLVTIPAQPEAVITSVKALGSGDTPAPLTQQVITAIKALDTPAPAAPGQTSADSDALANPPGDSGKANAAQGGAVQPKSRKPIMKTATEQISALEATRAAREARLTEVMGKSLAEGRPTDDAEGEEFDEIADELKRIDADLERFRRLEKLNVERAKAVNGAGSDAGTASRAPSRGPTVFVRSQDKDEAFKGQNFVRKIIAKAIARMDDSNAVNVAMHRWGKTNPTLCNIIKANEVPGGGTGSSEWGHELVTADTRYTGDFVEFLYAQTLFDKLPLRRVPADVAIKGQDGAATGYWFGESKALPTTTVDFLSVNLTPLQVGALAVISNRLIRASSPDAEMLVRDALVNASAQRVDRTFFSNAAAVADVSPAGILNGVTGIAASGTDAAALRADIRAAYAPFLAAENSEGLYFALNPALGKSIQLMVNALGQTEFGDLNSRGGNLLGDPAVAGGNVTATQLILLKPSDIWRIGDTGVQVSVSREATIEQSTVPTGATDTPVAASQAMTNMFQSESTAIKVVREISWAKRRASAVSLITGAAYA